MNQDENIKDFLPMHYEVKTIIGKKVHMLILVTLHLYFRYSIRDSELEKEVTPSCIVGREGVTFECYTQ